jgi:hypothetical protein
LIFQYIEIEIIFTIVSPDTKPKKKGVLTQDRKLSSKKERKKKGFKPAVKTKPMDIHKSLTHSEDKTTSLSKSTYFFPLLHSIVSESRTLIVQLICSSPALTT